MKCPYCLIGEYTKETELQYKNGGDETNDVLVPVEIENCNNCALENIPENLLDIPSISKEHRLEEIQEALCDMSSEEGCGNAKDCVTCVYNKTNFKLFVDMLQNEINRISKR